jgi:hypothetical protein
MNTGNFEERLRSQPLRPIPAEWRGEILTAAKLSAAARSEPTERNPTSVILQTLWRELIWPCRIVWAGVACAWLLIIGLNAASFERTPRVASKTEPRSGEEFRAFIEQRQLLAQLTDAVPEPANTRKPNPPGPRSDRTTRISAA